MIRVEFISFGQWALFMADILAFQCRKTTGGIIDMNKQYYVCWALIECHKWHLCFTCYNYLCSSSEAEKVTKPINKETVCPFYMFLLKLHKSVTKLGKNKTCCWYCYICLLVWSNHCPKKHSHSSNPHGLALVFSLDDNNQYIYFLQFSPTVKKKTDFSITV